MSTSPPHHDTANDAAIARAIAEQENNNSMMLLGNSSSNVLDTEQRAPNGNGSSTTATGASCPRDCGLQLYEVSPAQRVSCNVCGKRLNSGSRVWSCVDCNFDACGDCKERPVVVSGQSTNGNAIPHNLDNSTVPPSTTTPRTNGRALSSFPPFQMPQTRSHMCMVPCLIAGVCVEMMIDSGACTSVISLTLAKQLKLDSRIDRRQSGVAMGVGQARIVGRIHNVIVVLGHVEFDMDFSVLDVPEQQLLLLGLDQMRKYKCMIDLEKEQLVFGGHGGVEVPMLPPEQQPSVSFRGAEACEIM